MGAVLLAGRTNSPTTSVCFSKAKGVDLTTLLCYDEARLQMREFWKVSVSKLEKFKFQFSNKHVGTTFQNQTSLKQVANL